MHGDFIWSILIHISNGHYNSIQSETEFMRRYLAVEDKQTQFGEEEETARE